MLLTENAKSTRSASGAEHRESLFTRRMNISKVSVCKINTKNIL